ncbi:hypothetical protein CMT52_18645 [Elizabethkingia anophelis]|nr:hypothetical protein [Elizabethkingia anophelis]
MKTQIIEWHLTNNKLPIYTDEGQVSCLCIRRHQYKREPEAEPKIAYEVETLVFNAYHKCWDDESGDDYECDLENVVAWALLPTVKDVNDLYNFKNI